VDSNVNSVVMVTWVHQRCQAPRQLLCLPLDPVLFLAQLALQLRCAIETLLQVATWAVGWTAV
jgi:hypothetical protein